MAVYAPVPAYADRSRHPRTLLLIVGAHAALLAAVMSAKMDLPTPWGPTKTEVTLIPLPPEPQQSQPQQKQKPRPSVIDRQTTVVPIPQPKFPDIDTIPVPIPLPHPGPIVAPGPTSDTTPVPAPVRMGPRFITPAWNVKPPYPQQKLRLEQEAVLRLKLSIDERGRVTAVEPLGAADPVFLAAARRHVIGRWRYQPATESGRPVGSSTFITLRFKLEN